MSAADREFLFTYRFGGSEWSTSLFAADEAEAREKIKAQGMARLDGPLVMTIPAYAGLGGLVPSLFCKIGNWWRRK